MARDSALLLTESLHLQIGKSKDSLASPKVPAVCIQHRRADLTGSRSLRLRAFLRFYFVPTPLFHYIGHG